MATEGHSVPLFEGAQLRRRARQSFAGLQARAEAAAAAGGELGRIETLVQFAGFPAKMGDADGARRAP